MSEKLRTPLAGVGGFVMGVIVTLLLSTNHEAVAVVDASPAVLELIDQLHSDLAVERFLAAEKLSNLGTEAEPAIPGLVSLLRQIPQAETEDEESASGMAARALSLIGPRGVTALISEMEHREVSVREAAVRNTPRGEAGKEAVWALRRIVVSDQGSLRSLAAFALMDLDEWGKSAIPDLEEALEKEQDNWTRGNVASALVKLKNLP